MNQHLAKEILLLYRPGTADAQDPDFAEALEFAGHDPELKRWLEERCAVHEVIRARFNQITVPEGLKEQILSERRVHTTIWWRQPAVLAGAAAIVLVIGAVSLWLRTRPEDTFANYENRMVSFAVRGNYAMDLETNDLAQIQLYLAQRQAPADYVLPKALQQAAVTGCAVTRWQNAKVAMICFRTGRPLPPGAKSDLWLFVIDRASVKEAPEAGPPQFAKVNKSSTATWVQGDKVYFLATEGNQQAVRQYL